MALVIYQSQDEVLICEKRKEKELLEDYFAEGNRDLDEYDRAESKDGIVPVTSILRTRTF